MARLFYFTKLITRSLLALLLSAAGLCAADKALTLEDCYNLSLSNSMAVAIGGQVIIEASGRYLQAEGAVAPQVSFSAAHQKQGLSSGANIPSAYAYEDADTEQFTLIQPLFMGLKEYAGIKAFKAERLQRMLEDIRQRQVLLNDVSDTFYNIAEQRETEKIIWASGT